MNAQQEQEFTLWYRHAVEAYHQNKWDAALVAFDQALSIKPDHARAWHDKATLLSYMGRHSEALSGFNHAIEIDPKLAINWHGKGNSLRRLKRPEEAIEFYDKAIAIDPNHAFPWIGKALAFQDLLLHQKAVDAYDTAIQLDPNEATSWNNRGNSLVCLNRFQEAIPSYQKAISIDSQYPNPWNGMGNALERLKSYSKAIDAYNKAIAINSNYSSPWNGKGNVFRYLRRYNESLDALRKAVFLDPNLPQPWLNLAFLMLEAPFLEVEYKLSATFSRSFLRGGNDFASYLKYYDQAPLPLWVTGLFENSPRHWQPSLYNQIQSTHSTAIRLVRYLEHAPERFEPSAVIELLAILDHLFGNPIRANQRLANCLHRNPTSLRAHYYQLNTLIDLCFLSGREAHDKALASAVDSGLEPKIAEENLSETDVYYGAWIKILDTENEEALALLTPFIESNHQPTLLLGLWLAHETGSGNIDTWLGSLEQAQSTQNGANDLFSAYPCNPVSTEPKDLAELIALAAHEAELESISLWLGEFEPAKRFKLSIPNDLQRVRRHLRKGPITSAFDEKLNAMETLRREALIRDLEPAAKAWLESEWNLSYRKSHDPQLEAALAGKIKEIPVTELRPNFKRIIAYLFMLRSLDVDAATHLFYYLQSKEIYERGNHSWRLLGPMTGTAVEEEIQSLAGLAGLTASLGAELLFALLSGGVGALTGNALARALKRAVCENGEDAMPFPHYSEFTKIYDAAHTDSQQPLDSEEVSNRFQTQL